MIIPTTGLTPSSQKAGTADLKEIWSRVTRNSSCKEWLSRLGFLTEKKRVELIGYRREKGYNGSVRYH